MVYWSSVTFAASLLVAAVCATISGLLVVKHTQRDHARLTLRGEVLVLGLLASAIFPTAPATLSHAAAEKAAFRDISAAMLDDPASDLIVIETPAPDLLQDLARERIGRDLAKTLFVTLSGSSPLERRAGERPGVLCAAAEVGGWVRPMNVSIEEDGKTVRSRTRSRHRFLCADFASHD